MKNPRVIILQTTPYNINYSSRSLDAYFHFWDKKSVRQIYSRNMEPQKGHCSELYQITEANLLRCWLHRIKEPGKIYYYNDLCDQGENQTIDNNELISRTYRIGRKHTPTIELLREILWRKKYWCTEKLNEWLDEFNPELVFYNFTNNLFLQKIAIYIADRYNIPIVTAIGDDYYFNDEKSFSIPYQIFRKKYKTVAKDLLNHKGTAVYVCDKIRDKYNDYFNLDGETVYFNSTVKRKKFSPINIESPSIVYFGNIRLGRNNSLCDLADALKEINTNYRLQVYSNETDKEYYSILKSHSNIDFYGSIPYSEVQKKINECDIYVIVEGFRDIDITFTRFSLSTKAADGICSGAPVFAYGPSESGVIDYLNKTKAAVVCSKEKEITDIIRKLITDDHLQKTIYDRSELIAQKNHSIEGSTYTFNRIIDKLLNNPSEKEK